jgi:hypothetical protein
MDASIGDEKHDDIEQYTCKIAGENSIKGSSIPMRNSSWAQA